MAYQVCGGTPDKMYYIYNNMLLGDFLRFAALHWDMTALAAQQAR